MMPVPVMSVPAYSSGYDQEESKDAMSLIDSQFDQIDRMDYESFNFGAIDPNESMRVDMDDYSAIMI